MASRTWRDPGKAAIVAVLFAVCFALLVDAIGPRSPWLGLLLMFYFMGLAKVAEPLFQLPMPRALRDVGSAQADGGHYRRLGVRRFGSLLRRTPLRLLNAFPYLAGRKRSMAEVYRQAQSAEAIHFWAAVLFTPYIVYVGSRGLVGAACWFVVVQVVFNVYPILHLRLVRARLDRVSRNTGTRRDEKRQRE